MIKPRIRIRNGTVNEDARRTLIDDRSGVVIDVRQAGSEARPTLIIETYSYRPGEEVIVAEMPKRDHPWWATESVKRTATDGGILVGDPVDWLTDGGVRRVRWHVSAIAKDGKVVVLGHGVRDHASWPVDAGRIHYNHHLKVWEIDDVAV